jgi:hypothetical protein
MGIVKSIKNIFGNGLDEYQVLKVDEKWKFQKTGADRSIRNFETKNDAINYAKEYFGKREGELVIHKEDGSVQEKRAYQEENKE